MYLNYDMQKNIQQTFITKEFLPSPSPYLPLENSSYWSGLGSPILPRLNFTNFLMLIFIRNILSVDEITYNPAKKKKKNEEVTTKKATCRFFRLRSVHVRFNINKGDLVTVQAFSTIFQNPLHYKISSDYTQQNSSMCIYDSLKCDASHGM